MHSFSVLCLFCKNKAYLSNYDCIYINLIIIKFVIVKLWQSTWAIAILSKISLQYFYAKFSNFYFSNSIVFPLILSEIHVFCFSMSRNYIHHWDFSALLEDVFGCDKLFWAIFSRIKINKEQNKKKIRQNDA